MNEAGITPQRQNAEASWRPLPELTRSSTPRPVRLSVPGIFPVFVFFLLGFFFGLLFVDSSIELRRAYAFAQRMAAEGLVTSGKVTFVEQVSRGKTHYYMVGYRYQVDGKTYNSATRASQSDAMGLPRDRGVQVRYLGTDPARSWIVGLEPDHTEQWVIVLIVGSLVVLAGWLGIFFGTSVVLPQRFLLAEGLIAQGHVTGVRGRRSGPVHDVSYQFQVDGKDYGGLFSDRSEKAWATDAPVTILYDRDDPRHNARYPMPCVRIKDLFTEPANGHPPRN